MFQIKKKQDLISESSSSDDRNSNSQSLRSGADSLMFLDSTMFRGASLSIEFITPRLTEDICTSGISSEESTCKS